MHVGNGWVERVRNISLHKTTGVRVPERPVGEVTYEKRLLMNELTSGTLCRVGKTSK